MMFDVFALVAMLIALSVGLVHLFAGINGGRW